MSKAWRAPPAALHLQFTRYSSAPAARGGAYFLPETEGIATECACAAVCFVSCELPMHARFGSTMCEGDSPRPTCGGALDRASKRRSRGHLAPSQSIALVALLHSKTITCACASGVPGSPTIADGRDSQGSRHSSFKMGSGESKPSKPDVDILPPLFHPGPDKMQRYVGRNTRPGSALDFRRPAPRRACPLAQVHTVPLRLHVREARN